MENVLCNLQCLKNYFMIVISLIALRNIVGIRDALCS